MDTHKEGSSDLKLEPFGKAFCLAITGVSRVSELGHHGARTQVILWVGVPRKGADRLILESQEALRVAKALLYK